MILGLFGVIVSIVVVHAFKMENKEPFFLEEGLKIALHNMDSENLYNFVFKYLKFIICPIDMPIFGCYVLNWRQIYEVYYLGAKIATSRRYITR